MTRMFLCTFVLLLAACGSGDPEASETRGESTAGGATTGAEHGEASEAARDGAGLVMSDDACTSDADCVPSGCCHPASCVAAGHAEACGDVMCTAECRYGTLDCGGACLCHEGRCAARLSTPPVIPPEPLPPPS
jgi:hypothetical protein